jgi:RNA polymerase sigma-70 factor (ECF subfamily)
MVARLDIYPARKPVPDLEEDRTAVERSLAHPDSFALLYQKYVTHVYRYCFRRLRDHQAAEDVTSQIFLNAYRGLPSLGNKPFRPWIFSIAHNAVVDAHRRAGPPAASLDGIPDLEDPAETPEGVAIQRENRDFVRAVLDQLPKRDREVIELRLAGLDGTEIAQALHCSHGAVRAAHHRAMGRMRQLMISPGVAPAKGQDDGSR